MQKLRFTTAENPQLSDVISVKPGVGHHTALHDFSAAVNSAFFYIFVFLVHSASFVSSPPPNLLHH